MFNINQRVQIIDQSIPAKCGKAGIIERIAEDGQVWVKLDAPLAYEERPNFRDYYRTRNPEDDLKAIVLEVADSGEGDLAEASNIPDAPAEPAPAVPTGTGRTPDRFGFAVGDRVIVIAPGQGWSHNTGLAAKLGHPMESSFPDLLQGGIYQILSLMVGVDGEHGLGSDENAYAIKHVFTGKVGIVCNKAISPLAATSAPAEEPAPQAEQVKDTATPIIPEFSHAAKHGDVVMFGGKKVLCVDFEKETVAKMMFDKKDLRLFVID